MNKPLIGKTRRSSFQEVPAPDDYFISNVLPGRCRKELSPGYKEYTIHFENIREELPEVNDSIINRVMHFSRQHFRYHIRFALYNLIKTTSSVLLQYSILNTIHYSGTASENYNAIGKQYRNDQD